MPQDLQKPRSAWEKFARLAMATTSLSVGVMAATPTTITEGTSPAPANFPSSSPGYLLPVGTTTVIGALTSDGDPRDWFEFQGLQPGQAFSLHGSTVPASQEDGIYFSVYNSSNTLIAGGTEAGSLEGTGRVVSGTVPADGKLIVEPAVFGEGGNGTYEIDLSAPQSPQSVPAVSPLGLTVLGVGLALSGGLAWRSKRPA